VIRLETFGNELARTIDSDFLIEKRNALNEVRSNNLTLQELRFFSIYLAKINARDLSTRVVRFSVKDFQRIMELSKIKLKYLAAVTDQLLCKVVHVPSETGGFLSFQLFKECSVDKDKNGEWYVEIDAHDKALPLLFEFKERYFTYELWNALRLKSSNQLRMYEILKQYEARGCRVVAIDDLKGLLGLNVSDYPRFNSFRERVIDVCQQALAENTDIKFTYEPYGEKGRGGKIRQLKFTIAKNANHNDQLSLDDFIDRQDVFDGAAAAPADEGGGFLQRMYPILGIACGNEFSPGEMTVLYDLTLKLAPPKPAAKTDEYVMKDAFDYIKRKHDELNLRAGRKDLPPVKSRFGYIKKLMEAELDDK
jgi:plasmid replication initiation protein